MKTCFTAPARVPSRVLGPLSLFCCLDLFCGRSVLPLSACMWLRLPAAAHLPDYPHLPLITVCLSIGQAVSSG